MTVEVISVQKPLKKAVFTTVISLYTRKGSKSTKGLYHNELDISFEVRLYY